MTRAITDTYRQTNCRNWLYKIICSLITFFKTTTHCIMCLQMMSIHNLSTTQITSMYAMLFSPRFSLLPKFLLEKSLLCQAIHCNKNSVIIRFFCTPNYHAVILRELRYPVYITIDITCIDNHYVQPDRFNIDHYC